MFLTQTDLKNHAWLCVAVKRGPPSPELKAEGFNYFFTNYKGEHIAYKLEMLR